MKNLGIVIVTAAMLLLIGFIGNDELHPGGDFKDLAARMAIALAVGLIGFLLIEIGGDKDESRKR